MCGSDVTGILSFSRPKGTAGHGRTWRFVNGVRHKGWNHPDSLSTGNGMVRNRFEHFDRCATRPSPDLCHDDRLKATRLPSLHH
jgi:hypothetical protein